MIKQLNAIKSHHVDDDSRKETINKSYESGQLSGSPPSMMLIQSNNTHDTSMNNAINAQQPHIPASLFSFITPLKDSLINSDNALTHEDPSMCEPVPPICTGVSSRDFSSNNSARNFDPILGKPQNLGINYNCVQALPTSSGGSKKRKQIAPSRLQHNKNVRVDNIRAEPPDNGPQVLAPFSSIDTFNNLEALNYGAKRNFNHYDSDFTSLRQNTINDSDMVTTMNLIKTTVGRVDEKHNGKHHRNKHPEIPKEAISDQGSLLGKTEHYSSNILDLNKMKDPILDSNLKYDPSFVMSSSVTTTQTTRSSTTAKLYGDNLALTLANSKSSDPANKYPNFNFPYFGAPYFQYFLQDHYLQKGDPKNSLKQGEGGSHPDKLGEAFQGMGGEPLKISTGSGLGSYNHTTFPFDLPPLFPHQVQPLPPPPSRIFNPEAFCELCNKEFCNKYFLKTHKANKHGVFDMASLNNFYANNLSLFAPGFQAESLSYPISSEVVTESSSIVNNTLTDLPNKTENSFQQVPHCENRPTLVAAPSSSHTEPMSISKQLISDYYNLSQYPFPPFNAYSSFFPQDLPPPLTVTASNKISLVPTVSSLPKYDAPTVLEKQPRSQTPENGPPRGSTPQTLEKSQNSAIFSPGNPTLPYSLSPPQYSTFVNDRCSETRLSSSAESYCDICRKEFCNKYFLRKHKKNIHGILPSDGGFSLSGGNKGNASCKSDDGSSPNHSSIEIGETNCSDSFTHKYGLERNANPKQAKLERVHCDKGVSHREESYPSTDKCYGQKDHNEITKQPFNEQNECSICFKLFTNQHFLRSHLYNVHEQPWDMASHVQISPTSQTGCFEFEDGDDRHGKSHNDFKDSKIGRRENCQDNVPMRQEGPEHKYNKQKEAAVLVNNLKLETTLADINESCSITFNETVSGDSHILSCKDGDHHPTNNECANEFENYNKSAKNGKEYDFTSDLQRGNKREGECYCDICNKEFSTKYFLRTHKLNAHNIPNAIDNVMDQPEMLQSSTMTAVPLDLKVTNKFIPPFGTRPNTETFCNDPKNRDISYPTARGTSALNQYSQWGSSFCQICQKELCNKYFLKTHMIKMHGISVEEAKQLVKRNSMFPMGPLVGGAQSSKGGLQNQPSPGWPSNNAAIPSHVEGPGKNIKTEDGKISLHKSSKDRRIESIEMFPPSFPPFTNHNNDGGHMDPFNSLLYNPYFPYYFPPYGTPMNPYGSHSSSPFLTPPQPFFYDGTDPNLQSMIESGSALSQQPYKSDRSRTLKAQSPVYKRKMPTNPYPNKTNPLACPYCGVLNDNPQALASHMIQEHSDIGEETYDMTFNKKVPVFGGKYSMGRNPEGMFCNENNIAGNITLQKPSCKIPTALNKYKKTKFVYNYRSCHRKSGYYHDRRRMIKLFIRRLSKKKGGGGLHKQKFLYKKLKMGPFNNSKGDSNDVRKNVNDEALYGKINSPRFDPTKYPSALSHALSPQLTFGNIFGQGGHKLEKPKQYLHHSTSITDCLQNSTYKEDIVMQSFRLTPVKILDSTNYLLKQSLLMSPRLVPKNVVQKLGESEFPFMSTIVNLPMNRKVKDKVIAVISMEPVDVEG